MTAITIVTYFHYTTACFIITGQRLVKSIGPLFEDVLIEPCLLHGDLWSGNISSDEKGNPVILDPACYCKFRVGFRRMRCLL